MSWASAMARLSPRIAAVAGLEAAPRFEQALAQNVARVIEQAVRLGRCCPQGLGQPRPVQPLDVAEEHRPPPLPRQTLQRRADAVAQLAGGRQVFRRRDLEVREHVLELEVLVGLVEVQPLLAEPGDPLARRHVGDVGLDARGRTPAPGSGALGGGRDRLARQLDEAFAQPPLIPLAVELTVRAQQHLVDGLVGRQLAGREVARRLRVRDLVPGELGNVREMAGDPLEEHGVTYKVGSVRGRRPKGNAASIRAISRAVKLRSAAAAFSAVCSGFAALAMAISRSTRPPFVRGPGKRPEPSGAYATVAMRCCSSHGPTACSIARCCSEPSQASIVPWRVACCGSTFDTRNTSSRRPTMAPSTTCSTAPSSYSSAASLRDIS